MRIGVYFTPTKDQGGVYQYSVEILDALSKIKGNQYIIISTSPDIPDKFKKSKDFKIINAYSKSRDVALLTRNFIAGPLAIITTTTINVLYKLKLFELLTPIYKFSQKQFIEIIKNEKLDLMFYPTSSDLSFLSSVPAVVTVHDLQHRLNPQYKEVSAGGRWEYREYGFINIAKHAFRIFVDSPVGKKHMLRYYKESKGRNIVLPYLPPSYLNPKIGKKYVGKICRKLNLPEKYIFYPGKFWPHKNHANLVKALSILKKDGLNVQLVLTGSKSADFSTYTAVMALAKKLNVLGQIHYLGYVDDKELSAIYKNSTALVMPTAFGPTNIPVLEAWLMGTPVVYSDIEGCREQLGNAGLLINPKKPKDIAAKIEKIYNNKPLQKSLKHKGKRRLSDWGNRAKFRATVKQVMQDFKKQTDA